MDDGTQPTPTTRPTIRSASEEHAPQANRGFGQQPRPWPPKLPGTSGNQRFPETVQSAGQRFNRAFNQGLDSGSGQATALGGALMAGYGTAFSEAVSFINQAVERQNEMMGSMLKARGPQDIVTAGHRYLLGGWLAFFEVNVRVAQAASRLTQDAKHNAPHPDA